MLSINRYDEYGLPQASNAGRFQYTGQAWLPELGMYYYKARMYSATLGRFMQTDPIGYGDGMNWYNYVGSDPVNFVDPTGLTVVPDGGPDDIVVTGRRWRSLCDDLRIGSICGASGGLGLIPGVLPFDFSLPEFGDEIVVTARRSSCLVGNAAISTAKLGADLSFKLTVLGGGIAAGGIAFGIPPAIPFGAKVAGLGGKIGLQSGSIQLVGGVLQVAGGADEGYRNIAAPIVSLGTGALLSRYAQALRSASGGIIPAEPTGNIMGATATMGDLFEPRLVNCPSGLE